MLVGIQTRGKGCVNKVVSFLSTSFRIESINPKPMYVSIAASNLGMLEVLK